MTTTATVNLEQAQRLAEAEAALKKEAKANGAKIVKIVVTGTFPTAKRWNAEKVRKEKVEGGIKADGMTVVDIKNEWIFANDGKTDVYLKTDGSKNVSFVAELEAAE